MDTKESLATQQEIKEKSKRIIPSDINVPASKQQIRDAKQTGNKVLISHSFDNRNKRRATDTTGKILNNRKNPAKRRKVLARMAYFILSKGYRG